MTINTFFFTFQMMWCAQCGVFSSTRSILIQNLTIFFNDQKLDKEIIFGMMYLHLAINLLEKWCQIFVKKLEF
jgi:hypothetical protein